MLFILLLNSILSPQSLNFIWLLCHRDEKGQDVSANAALGEWKLWDGKTLRAEVITNVLKPCGDCWAGRTQCHCSQPSGPK